MYDYVIVVDIVGEIGDSIKKEIFNGGMPW
jgi:hypothetical protein